MTTKSTPATVAYALIATADAGEGRATVVLMDADDLEMDKIDLGEWGYLYEAVTELRARGWRVYEETIQRRSGTTGTGYYQTTVFRD
jgi:hypothetical protein